MGLHPEAKLLWKEHRNKKCKLCVLHKTAQTVCLMGNGPVPAEIMIVGEAPGFREDDVRKPFAGRSGQLLRSALSAAGIDPEQCFITNVNKCRPPDNRTPKASEATACRPYLDAELEAVKPRYILLVGNHALKVIKKSGIMKHRGEIYQFGDAQVMGTVHPAAVLRNPRYEMLFKTDLNAFARMVRGEKSTKKTKIYLVQDKKSMKAMVKACLGSKAIAYDIESNGFNEFRPDARIATVAVTPKKGVSFVLPVHHPQTRWKRPEDVLKILGNALLYSGAKLIAHNAKFDDRWLNHHGIPIHADFDTMIAAHTLDENRLKGLKPLSQILLGVDPWSIDIGDKAMEIPLKKLAIYNGKDTAYTLELYEHFKRELKDPKNHRALRLFKRVMMPTSQTLTDVERHGLWLDQDRLAQRTIQTQQKVEKIQRKIFKIAKMELNLNSPKQLAELLFDKLDLPIIETTKGGAASTKESVLLQLSGKHKVADLILEYRKQAKYLSTYLEGWAALMDSEGRIHPNYKICGTVTGRLSSGKEQGDKGRGLNAQQVPRDKFVRGVIGAPPGWTFVEADFSQAELRVAAHYSQDKALIRHYQRDFDVHMATAMKMTGKPAANVESEERKKAKAVNFGFLFGMGAKKFVDYARDNYGVVVSLDEAKAFRNAFFEEYDGLKPWHERQRRLARKYKQVSSLIGRIRHLPDIDSEDEEVRAEAERQAINSPVQGLASDFNLMAMNILHKMMPPSQCRIVASVHDAILFEIKDKYVKKWIPIIRHTMENLPLKEMFGVELDIPLKVDIKVGKHWSEGEEVAA